MITLTGSPDIIEAITRELRYLVPVVGEWTTAVGSEVKKTLLVQEGAMDVKCPVCGGSVNLQKNGGVNDIIRCNNDKCRYEWYALDTPDKMDELYRQEGEKKKK